MPIMVPVMKRELMNRMYTPTVYYLSRVVSGTIFQMVYPLIISLITFWCFGFQITASNFFTYLLTAFLCVLSGSSLGYLFGVAFSSYDTAKMIMSFITMYFYLVSGGFANAKNLGVF